MQYRVQAGDTISEIAGFLLGDINRWPEIARLNNIKSPYTIEVGQILNVPEIVPLKSTLPAVSIVRESKDPVLSTLKLPNKVFGIDTRYLLVAGALLLFGSVLFGKK